MYKINWCVWHGTLGVLGCTPTATMGRSTGNQEESVDAGASSGFDAAFWLTDAGKPTVEELYRNDPSPLECGPDGVAHPAANPPTGTLDCPSDKNLEGCPCEDVGEVAPCWPGLRADRGRGICTDGHTECKATSEFDAKWGACEDYQLPQQGATSGAEACNCFSQGRLKVTNGNICFIQQGGAGGAITAYSSHISDDGRWIICNGALYDERSGPPPEAWSSASLEVDCPGQYRLCVTHKAGNIDNPQASDCVVAETCVETWYAEGGVEQEIPNFPSWVGTNSACNKKFNDEAGYAE